MKPATQIDQPTNPRAQTAIVVTPDYHRGFQEGFNEGIKQAQKFIESQSNLAPIVICTDNSHERLVAALRLIAENCHAVLCDKTPTCDCFYATIARAALANEPEGE